MSITAFPSAAASFPIGSGRFEWLQLRPDQSASPNSAHFPPNGGAALTLDSNPAGCQSLGYDAADGGAYVARILAGGDTRLWPLSPRVMLQSPFYNAPSGVPYADPCGLLIMREVIRWTVPQNAGAGNARIGHGFAAMFDTQGNAGFGGSVFFGNVLAFVGLSFNPVADTFSIVTKIRANPAVNILPLAGIYDGGRVSMQWSLVEHRLYAPTPNAPGRYEFWLNQQHIVAADVLGTHASFPAVDANNSRYRPVPFIGQIYGGATGGIRVRRSEIIVGPATDQTAAYE